MKKISVLSSVVISAVLLSACQFQSSAAPSNPTAPAEQTQPVNTTNPSNQPTSVDVANNHSSKSSSNQASQKQSSQSSKTNSDVQQLLYDIWKTANSLEVIGSLPVTVGSTRKDVEKAWGKPDKTPHPQLAEYTSKHIIVHYYEDGTVSELDYRDPRLKKIKLSDVKKAFKKPMKIENLANGYHYYYSIPEEGVASGFILDFLPLEQGKNDTTLFQYRVVQDIY